MVKRKKKEIHETSNSTVEKWHQGVINCILQKNTAQDWFNSNFSLPPRRFQFSPDMEGPSAISPELLYLPLYSKVLSPPLAPALKEKHSLTCWFIQKHGNRLKTLIKRDWDSLNNAAYLYYYSHPAQTCASFGWWSQAEPVADTGEQHPSQRQWQSLLSWIKKPSRAPWQHRPELPHQGMQPGKLESLEKCRQNAVSP